MTSLELNIFSPSERMTLLVAGSNRAKPDPSGPRCLMLSPMLLRSSISTGLLFRLKMPSIPPKLFSLYLSSYLTGNLPMSYLYTDSAGIVNPMQ